MKTTCEHCHTDVDYHNGDRYEESHQISEGLSIVDYFYIICPNCKEKIKI